MRCYVLWRHHLHVLWGGISTLAAPSVQSEIHAQPLTSTNGSRVGSCSASSYSAALWNVRLRVYFIGDQHLFTLSAHIRREVFACLVTDTEQDTFCNRTEPWNTSKALWRGPVVSCYSGLAVMAQEAKSWDPGSIPGRDTSFDVPESSCLLSGPGLQLDSRYTFTFLVSHLLPPNQARIWIGSTSTHKRPLAQWYHVAHWNTRGIDHLHNYCLG